MPLRTFTLNRVSSTAKQTEGMILVGETQFHTLERPWLNNKPYVSCIPAGTYLVKRDKVGRHQYYAVQNVDGRSAIEIHIANKVEQLQGCIALGKGFKNDALIASEEACNLFLSLVGDEDFYLEIVDNT